MNGTFPVLCCLYSFCYKGSWNLFKYVSSKGQNIERSTHNKLWGYFGRTITYSKEIFIIYFFIRGFKRRIFSFLFMYTARLFGWNGYYLFIVVLLTLAAIILLVNIFHDFPKKKIFHSFSQIMYYLGLHRINHLPSNILGLCLGIYDFLID